MSDPSWINQGNFLTEEEAKDIERRRQEAQEEFDNTPKANQFSSMKEYWEAAKDYLGLKPKPEETNPYEDPEYNPYIEEDPQNIVDIYNRFSSNPAVSDFFDSLDDIPIIGQVAEKIKGAWDDIAETKQEEINKEDPSSGGNPSIVDWLNSLMTENSDGILTPSLDAMPLPDGNELSKIQLIAMKIKSINPTLAQELWNMSTLPIKQIIEVFNFRYDVALSQSNIHLERGRNVLPKISKKSKKRKRF